MTSICSVISGFQRRSIQSSYRKVIVYVVVFGVIFLAESGTLVCNGGKDTKSGGRSAQTYGRARKKIRGRTAERYVAWRLCDKCCHDSSQVNWGSDRNRRET